MRIATLLLAWVLILTPTAALAQQAEQQIYKLNITSEQNPKPEVLLQLRTYQRVRQLNADIQQGLEEAREIKQFSEPNISEFQRRNERLQRRPDTTIENTLPSIR
ncbi:hypothetical protein NUACC21_77900 [Scytonema sp. NUACC21]